MGDSMLGAYVTRSARLVDGILRGTRGTASHRPPEEGVGVRDALLAALPLAALYGLCMGLAAGPGMAALVALKIPLVLLLALLICFPSFYVFAALTGAPLKAAAAARALAASALLTGIVWAALAPVTGFFTVSTSRSSGFVATLHGVALGLGLAVGLVFLVRELIGRRGVSQRWLVPAPPVAARPGAPVDPSEIEEINADPAPPPPSPERTVSLGLLVVWIVVFAFVVCQLFADFAPYLESGPFVQPAPRFFLDVDPLARGMPGTR